MADHDGKNFLAFDLGAESGRAVVGTLARDRLSLAEKHRFANPSHRIDGYLHWNLSKQWEELKTGLRKTVEDGTSLAGIGVDTWGVDFGLIDSKGEILGDPFHYRDSRTDGVMERAIERVGREKIFNATGVQFMSLNTLYQLLAMRESKSPLLERAETLLFMPDLFNFLFTGERKCEASIASTSQMIDPRNGKWATDLLRELDLPTNILPAIVPCGSVIGNIRDDIAKECGTRDVKVIAPGCHDTASAVAAVPAETKHWCYISSGTWSLMGVELDSSVVTEKALRYNYTNEGGVGGSIRFLRNIVGLWLVQECRRFWKNEGRDYSYAELTKMAEEAPPLTALIDPESAEFLAPDDMPLRIAKFCERTNQSAPTTPGQFVRCCLESLALAYRRTLNGLQDILGRLIDVIHVVGGGSQNELLNQMTADACERPVIAGPVEATAIGNILVQAITASDVRSLSDARSIVRKSFAVKRFDPMNPQRWKSAYARYREIAR